MIGAGNFHSDLATLGRRGAFYHPACRDSSSNGGGSGGGFLIELVGGDEVDGQSDLHSILLGLGHQVFDDAGSLLVKQRCTNLTEARGREGVSEDTELKLN